MFAFLPFIIYSFIYPLRGSPARGWAGLDGKYTICRTTLSVQVARDLRTYLSGIPLQQ